MVANLLIVHLSYLNARAEIDTGIPLPYTIQVYCWEMQQEYNVSATLLMGIVYNESRGKADAKNGVYKGLTQINPRYFKRQMEELEVTDLFDPVQNLRVCALTLKEWFEKYGDEDVYLILECWSEGDSNAIKDHNPLKPSAYAKRIVKYQDEFTPKWDEWMERKRP